MNTDPQARGPSRRIRTLAIALTFVPLMWVGPWLSQASAGDGDAPPPPLAPTSERIFPHLHDFRETLPPFFRDADFTLHLRTYYFDRTKPDDSVNEALAFGGWLSFKSGWLLRQGDDLQLTQYDERGWRATFYTTGMEHSPTSATGTAREHTPWRATQHAAWEALRTVST